MPADINTEALVYFADEVIPMCGIVSCVWDHLHAVASIEELCAGLTESCEAAEITIDPHRLFVRGCMGGHFYGFPLLFEVFQLLFTSCMRLSTLALIPAALKYFRNSSLALSR